MSFERFWAMRLCDFTRRIESRNKFLRRTAPDKTDQEKGSGRSAAEIAAEQIEKDKKRKPASLRNL